MKVLVFGSGVIGCYLAHILCTAGNDVTGIRFLRKQMQFERENPAMTIHESAEDYLEQILMVTEGKGHVRSVDRIHIQTGIAPHFNRKGGLQGIGKRSHGR